MISCDTNILFAACDSQAEHHVPAWGFLSEHANDNDFCLCEQSLMELYVLLRNPSVCTPALSAADAVDVILRMRANPAWRIIDVPGERALMDDLWQVVAQPLFARRRIFDVRMAFTLHHHGVNEFATRNVRDFKELGFARVWDPLVD